MNTINLSIAALEILFPSGGRPRAAQSLCFFVLIVVKHAMERCGEDVM
jgi:hypothetical protein